MKVTANDVAELLAAAPPRRVPAHLQRAVHGGRGAWALPLFGLVFGGFGSLFVWIFFPWRFLDEWRLDASDATAAGEVRHVGDTNMSVNDVKVVEYVFAFTPADGTPRVGTSYTSGRQWDEGEMVTVRYLAGRPEIARIEGSRVNQGGMTGAFVVVFPLVGFGLVGYFVVSRARERRLLRDGRTAELDVRSVDATRMSVNYQTVYRITLSAPPGTPEPTLTIKRWAKPEINLLTRHALQKQPVFVLYDPRKPTRLIVPEALIEP